jgi:hypothetical protein
VEESAFKEPVTPAMAFAEGEPDPAVVKLNQKALTEMTNYQGVVVPSITLKSP